MTTMEQNYQKAVEDGKINGAVICVSDASGNFTYNKTFGSRTLLSGEAKPQQTSDVLFLASASKLLTSIAALKCVEEGLLSLKDDIASILPELADKQVITGFTDDDKPTMEAQAYPISLERLLTHSSGYSYDFFDSNIAKWKKHVDWREEGRTTVEQRMSYPLSFQPGMAWSYGCGLDWAGKAVERASGQQLGEYIRTKVLAPLGTTDAEFYPVSREDLRQRMVDLNPKDHKGAGVALLGGADPHNESTDCFGGHGLFMSAEDYHKVLRSLLTNDGKLLKAATVDDMFEPHLTPESEASMEALMSLPSSTAIVANGIAPETKRNFGLGSLLQMQDAPGWYGNRTLTWGGGMTIVWFIDRQNGLCGIGAPQTAVPADMAVIVGLKQSFREGIYEVYREWKQENSKK